MDREGAARACVFVAISAASVALIGTLSGCGGGDKVTSQDVQDAIKQAQQEQQVQKLQKQVNQLKGGQGQSAGSVPSSSSGSSGSGGSCGDGVSAGANTTCPFAENVAQAYRESGNSTVSAYSPARNQTYTMSCSGTNPVVCRGGDNASVY